MGRRALVGTVGTLGVVAFIGLFASLSLLFSSPVPAYAQGTNSAPEFTEGETATREVSENSPAYHDIGLAVTATDADADDRLTYSIDNAHTKNFTIHQRTGQLQVGSPLDHETGPSYTVTVKATDPSGDSDTIEVTINVTNADEDGTVTLSWTRPQVGTALTATLTDPDGSISGKSWQWQKSTNRSHWSNATGTGATSATYTPVANDGYLRATASYTDGEGSTKTAHARTATTVRQVPAPNNAPLFYAGQEGHYDCGDTKPKTFCANIRTSHPVGKSIYYPVKATDSRDEVRYSLEGSGSEHFYIEPLRGGLFTKTLPRELPASSYTITIKASDQSGESDTITVAITRLGSDRDPVIVGPSRITYPENGTWPVARYGASNEVGGTIGWFVSVEPGGGDGDFFRINDEGMLLFELPPDYESPWDENGNNSYSFSLTAYETNPPSGRPRMSFFSVTVSVVNVDEALEILGPSVIDYPENSQDAVHTYTVLGADGAVTWSPPSGTDGDNFSMNDGVLAFLSHPDYETPLDLDGGGRDKDQPDNGYLVAITVEDGTNIKTEHVKVRVTNVNEKPTFDDDLETTISVEPDAETPDHVGDPITATDPDENDYPSYSLPDDATLPFTISEYTGQLSVDGAIDSTKANYTVVVLATDGADDEGNPNTTADDRITVTINVASGGNNAPEFPTAPVTFSFDENTTTVQTVGTVVAATDDDSDDLTYTLGGTDVASFDFDATIRQIKTKSTVTYDYEDKSSYSVTMTADDDNGGTADKAVTISLTNVDEDGTVRLSTNQPTARAAVTATLTDPDGSISGTTWQWAKSSDGNAPWTDVGTDSASYTPPDADVDHFLRATASYTDDQASGKTAQAQTTQTVQTGTNRPADFSAASTTREVAENTAAGQPVGIVVEATDADGDTVTYSLVSGGDAGLFDIDTSTGQIKVKTETTLDYEGTRKSYIVSVEVTDGKNADGSPNTAMDDSITVTINVTDVDETPAFDAATAMRNIAENSAENTNVGDAVTATDPDAGTTLTYSLSGADAGSFTIDSSGQIKVGPSPTLDYESAKKTYTVVVEVRDISTDTNPDATIDVTITVTDVNEKPAFTETDPATRSVPENTSAGQEIGNAIAATDPENDTLTYTLGGTDAANFSIVGTSGQLQTKSALNREAKASYEVTISVRDSKNDAGSPDTADDTTITVNINVTEENDPPTFPSTTDTREIAENTGAGVDIGAPVAATDDDTGDTQTYTLEGTDAASFDIESTSGQIKTKSGITYNHEDKETYSVTVKVVDSKDGTDTIDVTITVTDVNEKPAFTETDPATRSVPENTSAGQEIGNAIAATDPENDTLTYTLGGTDVAHFGIVGTSGQLQTKSALNREAKASYEVTISVRDSKNDAGAADTDDDATITVTITVTEENELPVITGPSSRNYAEKGTEPVGSYSATDPDGTPVILSLMGPDSSKFGFGNVETNTGRKDMDLVFKTPPDYEARADADGNNVYEVTIRASSGGETTDHAVTVTVANVNESPQFPNTENGKRSIAENTLPNMNVGAPITATDPDNGDTLTYSLSGTDADSFNINTSTGQLQTKAAPDFEDKPEYYLTVWVSDSKGNDGTADTANDASILVIISVTDVNEPPAFPSTEIGRRNVDENSSPGSNIGVPVEAIDPEGDALTYTLDRDEEGLLSIDVATGQIRMANEVTLDHETTPSYTVIVSVSDSKDARGNPDTITDDTVTVTITVADGDEPPVLTGQAAVSYPENGDGPVHTYTAIDPERATIKWSLTGDDDGDFSFEGGVLAFDRSPDYETPTDTGTNNQYSVTVVASDGPNPVERAVTVTVTNVNEPPAFLSGETGFRVVDENTATGQVIGDPVGATDPDDGDRLAYTLGGTDAASFYIDTATGQLKTNAALDYETKSNYSVTVSVSDGKDANGGVETTADATIPVTIVVDDVNEPPEFDPGTATRTIAENTAADQNIGSPFTATDPDDYTLSYSLGGTDAAIFRINASTGQLQTRGPLDHEGQIQLHRHRVGTRRQGKPTALPAKQRMTPSP